MNYVRVGGYIPPQPIEDYNDLPNIPVISQDLTASGFTPIANTYYKHTGATTASYTNGVIYYYNSTGYIALDGSAYGLATVAKTGSYNDLSNKPTIPDAANNGTLTIQKNGTNVATFTANQSGNVTANITVPLTPFYSDDLSTGTYRSTNLPSGHSLIYIEDRERRLSGYFYKLSAGAAFQEIYFITSYYTVASSGQTTLVIYKLQINGTKVEKTYTNLFVSSSGKVEVGTEYVENGTFYYKVLK